MLCLIDSDSLCYANGFAVEEKDDNGKVHVIENGEKFLRSKLAKQIETIVEETGASDYKVFLTGKGNFREKINPIYKANRVDMRRPLLLPQARQYLIEEHNALVVEGMEADDVVCIEQTYCLNMGIDSCIAHIDKDINQQVGKHYRWKGKFNDSVMYEVSEADGLRNLYVQALVGDKVDNIMYYYDKEGSKTWKKNYGIGQKTAEKFMAAFDTEKEMYDYVLGLYLESTKFIKVDTGKQCKEEDLLMNMKMLYMLRDYDDEYGVPK